MVRDYSDDPSWVWATSAADVGAYNMEVLVRSAGSTAVYEAARTTELFSITSGPPAIVSSISASPSSPAAAGTTITWTATASGGDGPLEYEFWRYSYTTSVWTLVQAYSTSASYTWTPTASDAAVWVVRARVRTVGVPMPYESSRNSADYVVINGSPISVTSLTPSPASSAPYGTPITWTAVATGGTPPLEYKFWRYTYATGKWTMAQDYSTSATHTWTPGAADVGTHSYQVWARSAGSTATYEAWRSPAVFTVTPPPAISSLSPSAGIAGEPVSITGANFGSTQGTSVVAFNGVAASVTGWSDTSIQATVPAGASSGPVVVTVNGSNSNGIPFTVIPPPATLTVKVYYVDEAAPGLQGPPAEAGVYVRVDGVTVGQTGDDGTLTVQVAPGDKIVTAIVPSAWKGEAAVTAAPGESLNVTVLLSDGEVTESTPLVVAEAVDGIVPITSPTFTMEFVQDGNRVPVARLEQVELLNKNGNVEFELSRMFVLTDGRMSATDPATFFLWLPNVEPTVLRVGALDAAGFSHVNTVEFSLGQLRVNLALVAPPSNPALAVSNIEVSVAVDGTSTHLRRITDGTGHVELPLLPYSTLTVSAESQAGGDFYYGDATVPLTSDTSATLVMRSLTDIVAGVPPLNIDSGGATAMVSDDNTSVRSAATYAAAAAQPQITLTAAEEGPTATVTATSDVKSVPVEATAKLTVPKGTEKVTLKYTVTSAEYPVWVRQNSPYDDKWGIRVFAGRQRLFAKSQQVNAQLYGDPTWQADGSTREIQEEIDVKAPAANQDVELTLTGSSENVKDSLLPTTVTAVLGATLKLGINKVEEDKASVTPDDPNHEVLPTKGDSTYYSIPPNGEKNFFERWFTLKVMKPSGTTVERVSLTLKDAAGTVLQKLINDEGEGANVKITDQGRTIKVRASMQSVQSGVVSLTHYLRYEFVVKGTRDGNAVSSDPKSSSEMRALWRMPQIFGRYSLRETGLDDWASLGACVWLTEHAQLMMRINDISGEHALNLGHAGHYRGIDIDMFHFHTFDANRSGEDNYKILRSKVIAALNGDAAAKGAVTAWVSDSRSGLDALLALADVNHVYSAVGNEYTGAGITLDFGWAEALLKTGALAASGKSLDTELGAWSNAKNSKFSCNDRHNSHVHVALDDSKLPK